MSLDFDFSEKTEKGPSGSIADSIASMDQQDQAMLNNARIIASQISPDEAAEIKHLADKNGITFEMAKADKVKAKTDEMLSKMQEVRQKAPYLSKLLGNTTYMSLCQDDIDNLMKIETNFAEKTWDVGRSAVAAVPDMIGGVGSGFFQLAAMYQRGKNAIHQGVANKAMEIMKNNGMENSRTYSFIQSHAKAMDETTKFMNEFATGARQAADDSWGAFADRIRPEERRQNVATRIAETVGQIGTQVAMGGYGWIAMGLNTLDDQQQLMREKGIYGTGRADMAAASSAVLEGLIERQALGRYLNKANLGLGWKRRLIRAGVNAGLEGLEEGTQNITTDMIDMYVGGIEKDWADIGKDAAVATFYAAAGAGLFSSAQGLVPSNRTQRRQERLRQERLTNGERINLMNAMIDKGKSILGKGNVGEAEMKAFEEKGDIEDVKNAQGLLAAFADKMTQDAFSEPVIAVQGLTQLGDIADASKTLKRDKATFIKMVDEITKQSGTNVVYFNAADLKESFGENEGDLKAVLYQMDVGEEEFNQAVETGSDIQVGTGTYVANIAKNEQVFDQMNKLARLKEDAPSYNEVNQIVQQTRKEIAEYKEQTQREMTPREQSSRQVYENVFQALRGLKINKTEADAIATIWTARANTFTAGKDMMPMDWFNRATRGNLTITRKGVAAQISTNDNLKFERIPKENAELIKYIYELRRPVKEKGKLGQTLLEFLGKRGGLKNDFGELKAMDADKWHKEKPGRPRLMREDGVDLDDAALAAWEAGYFGYGGERPDINDLLELIREELAGRKIYPQTGDSFEKQMEIEQKENEYSYVDDILTAYGLSLAHSDINKIAEAIRDFQQKEKIRSENTPQQATQSEQATDEDFDLGMDILAQSSLKKTPIVDLTASFKKNPSIDDVKNFLDKVVKEGSSYATLSPDWLIDVKGTRRSKQHIAYSDAWNNMSRQEKNRHNKYVIAFEKIVNNSEYSHTRRNTKIDKKPNVSKYHYFTSRVKIGDKIYDIVLDTEQYKGESEKKPQTVHLYNIKEAPASSSKTTIKEQGTSRNNIAQSNTDVNTLYQSAFHGTPSKELEGGHFSLEKINTGEGTQAHGYGLYFTTSYNVADNHYRKKLAAGYTSIKLDGKEYSGNTPEGLAYLSYKRMGNNVDEAIKDYETSLKENADLKGSFEYEFDKKSLEFLVKNKGRMSEIEETKNNGQVYEVDIPENPFMIDEQATFENQSPFVQEVFERISSDFGIQTKGDIQAGVNFHGVTGKYVYNKLAGKIGSSEKASKILHDYGIKGITYNGKQDGRCFVIFNPDDVKVIQKFYQDGIGGKANAAVDFTNENRILLKLFEGANKSTLLHETAHIFLRDLIQSAVNDKTSAAQLEVLKKWFGSKEISPQNEEKFARAFEKYFMEGKAPSEELCPVFARFRRWLLDIYKSLMGIDRAAGQTVNITPEIRALFDSLIATDEQIHQARVINAQDTVLPEDYFKTKEEYQVYLENLNNANERAFDKVVERRADAIAKMREREYLAEFKQALEEAKLIVAETPQYQLVDALNRGEVKLNKSAVESYGNKVSESWLDENGLMPDDVASEFGWQNGDAMMTALETMPSAQEAASKIAGQTMLERHDELFDELSIKDSAARAIYNNETIERLVQEEIKIKGERPATKTKDILLKAVQAGGNNIIRNALLSEATNVRKYAKQAMKAGEDYEYAIRNNIRHKALEAKHRQAMASYLVKRAYEAEVDVRKAERYFNDIKGREAIVGTKYFEQIKALLARHGYWDTDFKPRQGFAEFAEALKNNGEPVPVVNPGLLETGHQNYWKMTYGDFMNLYEAVKSIYTVGRNSRLMMKEGKKQELETVAKTLTDSIYTNTKATKTATTDMLKERTTWERFTDKLKQLESWLVKTEQVCLELDGGQAGVFTEEFYKRMSDAETATNMELNGVDLKLAEIFKNYDAAKLAMKFQIGPKEMTFKQILMLGMNWGNEGNRQAILNSPYGLTEFNIRQALAKLSKEDWDNIQKTWDLMESYRDRSFDLEERMTGVRPKAVEPSVVHTAFGDYKGGYFPIAFDPEKSSVVEDREIRRAMDNQFSTPQFRRITNRGFLKSRQGSVQPVLLNDLNVVKKHFVDLITDLNYREAKIDMVRLLKNEDLKKAIQSRIGRHGFDSLQKWVLDSGLKQMPVAAPDRVLDTLRINAVKFSMAGNVKVMATQFSGLGATMAEVGGFNTVRWLGHYLEALSTGQLKTYGEFILSRSKFMQLRAKELDRDLKDFYNKNIGKSKAGIFIDDKVEFLLQGIQKMDFVVSSISWRAGYEKAILEGKTEAQAVAYADSVVRLTQGAGRGVDQSRIQRENSTWKMITSFYSVFNVMYNRYRRAIRDIQLGRGYERLIREACYTWLTQAALEGLIRWLFDYDKKKNRSYVSHFAEQAVSQLFSTNPITFYASSGLGRIAAGENAATSSAQPIAFTVFDTSSRAIQNIVKGNGTKALKNVAEGVGMSTGFLSRAEITATEAMLNQLKKGYFDPMEYISGVKRK